MEINGIGGEAIDCWDPRLAVGEVYRRLVDQQRLLFLIGERNRARGFRPTGTANFVASLIRQTPIDPPLSGLGLSVAPTGGRLGTTRLDLRRWANPSDPGD